MLYYAIGLFVIAAILGLIILNALIKKRETPKPAVIAHGLFAAAALGVLIYYAVENPTNFPKASLIILGVGALAGFYLLARDLRKKPGPVGLAVIHMLAGLTGVVLLLLFVFS
jgi:hypothetical protein